ncbi:acid sphingomyelinase-like phosphodiesterase 3b isoform X1 [Callorhinchus milii]|uniref:acid sphingomyelinase-like phosphodiesterase 3b isoform X1 n=2 Tax=Callorhinchus milii TaxID=7868 RepID=UPI001C3F73FF|nr:acid sphingomyelinase-like phosphodiesterase 3b isoform X1 [Callorhinchus milii]
MEVLKYFLLIANCGFLSGDEGQFWHISDIHWDPDYKVTDDPNAVCPSSSKPVQDAGKWGNYLCDANWDLINTTIYTMGELLPNPDFILWTGDDTPHVADQQLGEEAVLRIIGNLTQLIQQVFPDTKVYSALGNHDFHPKNQFPGFHHSIYNKTAELWASWLNKSSVATFTRGAFYSEKLVGSDKQRIIVLNTNLYYTSNKLNADVSDPAGQFEWLEETLSNAVTGKEKVYIIGHLPPGLFEKKRSQFWFRKHFNKKYIQIIQKYHIVIAGQFFGHHHTDSFRMFYNDSGSPIGVMFLAPGITPWKTTLPGVENGANNPGIRVFKYDKETMIIKDMMTYYFDLALANAGAPNWKLLYTLKGAFGVADGSPGSMQKAVDWLYQDSNHLQEYYNYNSVNYDLAKCDFNCRIDHICAIKEVDFDKYEQCVVFERSSSSVYTSPAVSLLLSLLFLLSFQVL